MVLARYFQVHYHATAKEIRSLPQSLLTNACAGGEGCKSESLV
jgi:hypothetical protein